MYGGVGEFPDSQTIGLLLSLSFSHGPGGAERQGPGGALTAHVIPPLSEFIFETR